MPPSTLPPAIAAPPRPPAAPVTEPGRIGSLDVLRGFALLGILVINIQAFSMISAAYFNPHAYGDLTGANFRVWSLSHLLADQKFLGIFSMLFGAGILLMAGRAEATGGAATRLHVRRMAWLGAFGLLHAYLLWYGDILFPYAVCGLLVYPLRRLRPSRLIAAGLVTLAVGSALFLFFGWSMRFWPPEQIAAFEQQSWQPPAELVEREVAAYRSGWLGQMPQRAEQALFMQTGALLTMLGWKAAGMMLIGMGLFKLGVLSAACSARVYLGLIAAAVFGGLPLIAYGIHWNFEAGWDARYSFFHGTQFNYWGSVLVALGWIGAVMLAYRSPRLAAATRRLGAVGRTAFSNYILQTLICTAIFYGHGAGLFGAVERVGQIALVAAIWALQLAIAPLWLRRYEFGPLEWLWRRLTYSTPQPMRRAELT